MATSQDHMRTIVGDLTIQVAVLRSEVDALVELNNRLVTENAALSVRLEKFEPKPSEIAKESKRIVGVGIGIGKGANGADL